MHRCLIRLATLVLIAAAIMPALAVEPLDAVFAGREAAFVVAPAGPGAAVVHNPAMADERLPPFSTFKIWNTLIAIETGAMPDQHVRLDWDAARYPLPDWAQGWKRPHDMESAFAASAVWYFREVAGRIGPERMRHWLDGLGYGNADIASGVRGGRLDDFWNNGSLRVSASEQARLLADVLAGRSPFGERAVRVLHDIALTEEGEGWRLYGKTGSGPFEDGWLGWYLGWIEGDSGTHAFALVLRADSYEELRDARLELSKRALEALGLIRPSGRAAAD